MHRVKHTFVAFLASLSIACAAFTPVPAPPTPPPVVVPPPVIVPPVEPPPVPPTPILRPEVKLPARCASYYASPTDPDLDIVVFAQFLQATNQDCTRGWLLDAWAIGQRDGNGKFLPGQYQGFLPVLKRPDGKFDLFAPNPAYYTHLREYVDVLNMHGVWPHLTILELYSWSDRKASNRWVPDANLGPYRNNVNDVRWGNPDDPTFFSLPDPWLASFICKVVQALDGTAYAFEIGNEMPEKPMHERIRAAVEACGFTGLVTVNRQDDSPGQYWNMGIDRDQYDAIAHHGFMDIGYLDVEHPDEAPAGRPTTFRAFWATPGLNPARVIVSSDGSGGDPAHQPGLLAVAKDALARGASYEHQLALKRNRFWGDGTLRMADLELDRAFLLALTARVPVH
jgi:hypothetical protein